MKMDEIMNDYMSVGAKDTAAMKINSKYEKFIEASKNKTIFEKDMLGFAELSYEEHVESVKSLVKNGILSPVTASGLNGRNPSLYNKYRIINNTEIDTASAYEHIKLLHPYFNHQLYFERPKLYIDNEFAISALSDYLWNNSTELLEPMSINERSLKIWGYEKYLKVNYALLKNIFKFNNWTLEGLNFYETPEPFFEYVFCRSSNMTVLIIENKDTWYTLRKVMTEFDTNLILGTPFNAILYGEGRKITRNSGRLEEYAHEMFAGDTIEFYYFGDLDYEGISIYQDLVRCNKNISIKLFVKAYEVMIELSKTCLVPTKNDKRSNKKDAESFMQHLSIQSQTQLLEILESGRYIPQEIINYQVLTKIKK